MAWWPLQRCATGQTSPEAYSPATKSVDKNAAAAAAIETKEKDIKQETAASQEEKPVGARRSPRTKKIPPEGGMDDTSKNQSDSLNSKKRKSADTSNPGSPSKE
jgi:hypothetical protein